MTEQRFEVSTYKEGGTAGDKITGWRWLNDETPDWQ
jgi:hypothetical protein